MAYFDHSENVDGSGLEVWETPNISVLSCAQATQAAPNSNPASADGSGVGNGHCS